MINIKKKFDMWDKFKRSRNLNPNLQQDDPCFITVQDREKLIDELFDYVLKMEKNASNSIPRDNR